VNDAPRVGIAATAVAAFLCDAGFYLVVFTLTHALEATGATSRAVALVLGIYTLAYAVAAPLLGGLSDRFRFVSVLSGATLFALVYTALAAALVLEPRPGEALPEVVARVADPRTLTYAAMTLLAVANALFWPALQARIGDRVEDAAGLARAIRAFNVAWTTGKASGFLVGGFLFPLNPQACLLAVAVGGWVVVGAILSEGRVGRRDRKASEEQPETTALPQGRKWAFLLSALLANFVLWGAVSTLAGLAPKLAHGLGLNVRETGVLLCLALLAQGGTFLLLGSGKRWAYRAALLAASVPVAGGGLLLLTVTGSLVSALLGAALLGAAQAVTYAASVFYSLDYDERRGLRTGIHEAVLAAGGALPIVGGQLADSTGELMAPVWLTLALAAPAALVVGVLLLRAEPGAPPESTNMY